MRHDTVEETSATKLLEVVGEALSPQAVGM